MNCLFRRGETKMSLKGKSVFVTGISGFVGSHLAKHLLNEGSNVFGLVRRRADGTIPQNLKYLEIEKDIRLIEGDVRDISSIASALDVSKPDIIFHFAAQSFIPRSFSCPGETMEINCLGTANLLEAVRSKGLDAVIVFADYLMRNYHTCYGLKTIVSRGFNQEGAGRGRMFVTSSITRQVMQYKRGEIDKLVIGNVNAFRDWSHVNDILEGYSLLAEKGRYGDVYNQGSQRTNSVLSYLLLSLECAGYAVNRIETLGGKKVVDNPNESHSSKMFGLRFEKTRVDKFMLEGKLEFQLSDTGIVAITDKGKITVEFDEEMFRLAEVPILLAKTAKIEELGFQVQHSLRDIINDQLNYFLDSAR